MGSTLIPKLLDRGYKVDVVDLFWFGNHLPRQVGVVNKDIFDLTVEDLHSYDQVIFLAGLSNDPMAEFSPSKNFIFNAAAPAYLAYTAKNAKVKRYIYASSCSVYGYTEDELFDETRPVSSNYPYGISKLQGEQAAMQFADKNFSVIALRKRAATSETSRSLSRSALRLAPRAGAARRRFARDRRSAGHGSDRARTVSRRLPRRRLRRRRRATARRGAAARRFAGTRQRRSRTVGGRVIAR